MTQQLAFATDPHFHHPSFHRQVDYPLSWQARMFNLVTKLTVKPVLQYAAVTNNTMNVVNQIYRLTSPFTSHVPDFVKITPVSFENCYGEWIRSGKRLKEEKVIYYLHGGGYFFSSIEQHRPLTWRLSRSLHRPVFAINYRKAPEWQFHHWLDDAVTGYTYLLDMGFKSENIIVAGDSAGGNLTLILMQALKFSGIALPSGCICISPWTDIACEGDSMHTNRDHDPLFAAAAVEALGAHYAKGASTWHPWVSPLHSDLTGLPPLLLIVGSTEVLRDDALRLADRARASGVPVVYEEWAAMPHVFPLFAFFLPEGRRAYKHIARFVHDLEKYHADGYSDH